MQSWSRDSGEVVRGDVAGQRVSKVAGHRGHRGDGESKEDEESVRQHLEIDAPVTEECRGILPWFDGCGRDDEDGMMDGGDLCECWCW